MSDQKAGKKGQVRIGTSGYQYDHWRSVVYPESIPKTRWFEHYAGLFDTVEINNTFYNLPAEKTADRWCQQAPEGFVYALKFSRYASHIKRLKDPDQPIERFMQLARRLGSSLGLILVQLPGRWRANPERLDHFLARAPNDHHWALEFRDPSWLCEEIYSVLEKHGAALCLQDMLPEHPERLTAGWTYLRFHGEHYTGSYSSRHLKAQAGRIRSYLDEGIDVYAYFNNDVGGHAAQNALELKRHLQ